MNLMMVTLGDDLLGQVPLFTDPALTQPYVDGTLAPGESVTVQVTADATVRVRRIENKLGLHGSPTCELQFTDTPARLIGDRRFGLIRYAMAMMNGARLAVSAQALGIAEAAYREAHRYACQRVQFGQPICEIPAVYRMLLNMRADIEAARALLYETARWVDLSKAIGRLKDRGGLTPDGRRRQKQASRLADVLTPLLKYSASEMANRVAYQAMQVHGGVGYMREFAVERHYRDARITNIYEGTSQLQVVAATSGLLGHALDGLLDEWAAEGYGDQLTDLKTQLQEATGLLNACIDGLKEEDDRAVIDYYAPDLADMAVYVISSWLTLRDARETERKRDVARFYITDAVPRIHASAEILMNRSRAPVQLRHRLLNDSA